MTATYGASGRTGLRHGLGWLAMAAGAALLLPACGGSKKPNPPVVVAPPPPAPPVKPPPKPAEQKKELPKPAAKPAEPKPVEKPPLAEDVSKWMAADYQRAKVENSPKLPEAVAYLAKRFAGTDNADAAAQLVANLLKPEPPPAAAPAGAPGSPAAAPAPPPVNVNSALLKAEIDALATLGSPVARKCLEGLVAGTVPSGDAKQAAEAALEALAKNPSAQSDEILFRLLTARGEPRPAAAGGLAADELQKKAYAVVLPTASAELRLKLAAFALEPTAPQEQQDTILKTLQTQEPANIPAQILLYQNEATAPATKTTLQGFFQAYSSEALAGVMGMSPDDLGDASGGGTRPTFAGPSLTTLGGPRPEGPSKASADLDLPYRLVKQFWGPKFTRIVAGQLADLPKLEKGASTVVLASTIPTDALRAAIYKALRRHCEEGPKALEAAGLTDHVFCDPGLLAVLKSLPIKVPSASHVAGLGAGGGRTQPTNPRSRSGASAGKVSKQLSEEEWMITCGSLARSICHRCDAVVNAKTAAQRKAGHRADFHEATAKRPIELHPNAHVVAEYHLDWPDGLSGKEKLAGLPLDPMTIHYVRMEEQGKPRALEGYYRRKIESEPTCPIPDGLWLESFHTAQARDRKISYDLLITLPKDAAAAAQGTPAAAQRPAAKRAGEKTAEQEMDLVIELLYLDVKDPSGQSGGESAESGKDAAE